MEDNQEVAAITADIIRNLGYEVVQVDRARKALEILTSAKTAFQLLITDVVMPDGMDGLQLAQQVRRELPSLPRPIGLITDVDAFLASMNANLPSSSGPKPPATPVRHFPGSRRRR